MPSEQGGHTGRNAREYHPQLAPSTIVAAALYVDELEKPGLQPRFGVHSIRAVQARALNYMPTSDTCDTVIACIHGQQQDAANSTYLRTKSGRLINYRYRHRH